MRLLASLENYLATTAGDTLYLHQLTSSAVTGAGLAIEVSTRYPWDGRVTVLVTAAPDEERGIGVRIPGWGTGCRYRLNDDTERAVAPAPGYLLLNRRWRPGDVLTVHLDLTPRWTLPDRRVDAVRGCVAVERGPLVYCFEQADQPEGAAVDDIAVPSAAGQPAGALAERALTLPGVGPTVQVTAPMVHLNGTSPGASSAASPAGGSAAEPEAEPVTAAAIPYFQWDNRDGRPMRVWMPLREETSPADRLRTVTGVAIRYAWLRGDYRPQ